MYFFDVLIFCLFAPSAESVEEILQLFGNYHQLSEILKEKANTTGMILLHFHKQNTSFLYHSKNMFILWQCITCICITHDSFLSVKCVFE